MKYAESLKKNKDFQNVYKNGTSYANRYLVMYMLRNQVSRNRLGISVSKKVGNSVVRHRLTRLIRESYRLNEEQFLRDGFDIVVIVRNSARGKNYREMEKALMNLGKRHQIIGKTDKKRFDQTNSILSEIYLPYENDKMSLYPYLFSVWIRGG